MVSVVFTENEILKELYFDPNIFKDKILPQLLVYEVRNTNLRNYVSTMLKSAADAFYNDQNVSVFTKLCNDLYLDESHFREQQFTMFKKRSLECFEQRQKFNLLELVAEVYNLDKKIISNISDNSWRADSNSIRGYNRIGEGEIFFSFFSNGLKPKKGDITIDQTTPVHIEFKGSKGRLLPTDKILICENFKNILKTNIQPTNIAVAIAVITGVISSNDGYNIIANEYIISEFESVKKDVLSTITATNVMGEIDMLLRVIEDGWPRNTQNSSLRAVCGGVQLALYKKRTSFDYIVLTSADEPYICLGLKVYNNILSNTLTIINNNIKISQNNDGKGFHIQF